MSRALCRGFARGLLAFLSLATTAAGTAHAQTDHATLALPADAMQFLALYAAEDFHFVDQQGLELKTIFIAGIGSFNAVVSGAVDFSVGSGASLAARARLLKGLRIGVGGINTVAHAYLKLIAQAGDVDPDNGMIVAAMQPADIIAAMARRAIDGFVDGPPWPQKAAQEGSAVIIAQGIAGDPDWLAPIGSGVIIARPQTCAEHRALCVKLGHAVALGATFIHEHRDEALTSLRKRFPQIDAAALSRSLDIVLKSTPDPPVVEEAAIANGDRMNVEAEMLRPEDMLKSYGGLYTDEFVR